MRCGPAALLNRTPFRTLKIIILQLREQGIVVLSLLQREELNLAWQCQQDGATYFGASVLIKLLRSEYGKQLIVHNVHT